MESIENILLLILPVIVIEMSRVVTVRRLQKPPRSAGISRPKTRPKYVEQLPCLSSELLRADVSHLIQGLEILVEVTDGAFSFPGRTWGQR